MKWRSVDSWQKGQFLLINYLKLCYIFNITEQNIHFAVNESTLREQRKYTLLAIKTVFDYCIVTIRESIGYKSDIFQQPSNRNLDSF